MWFNRNPKNRRSNRGHVLDVKLRSDQVRKSRMRLASLAFGVLFATVFGFYLLWQVGKWTLNRLVYENNTFAVQHIDMQTDGVISLDQLRRWADVKPGQNLFALDFQRVKRNLEIIPHIEAVSVERVLPRTLRVRVTEREAVAQVNVLRSRSGNGMTMDVFHLDPKGCVMIPLDPRQRTVPLTHTNDTLPVLKGVKSDDLRPGHFVESPQTLAALRLISEFGWSPMAGMVDLRSVDVASPEVMVVTTGQGGEVTFGLADLERQLRRWRQIYDLGQRRHQNIATLDLAVTNNIPVTWLASTAPPPPPPKAPKITRSTKRRNV